jgi:hypothetical protein
MTAFGQQQLGRATSVFRSDAGGGYYIKDGLKVNALLYTEKDQLRETRLYVPQQPGHEETIYTPDQISGWGIEDTDGLKHYTSVCLDSAQGEKWFFMQVLQTMDDGSSILFISRANFPDDTFFLSKGGKVEQLATRLSPDPMWDYLKAINADCTKDWSVDVEFPNRLIPNMIKRYHNAFAYCNEKMFPQPRFGVMATVGMGRPDILDERTGETAHEDTNGNGLVDMGEMRPVTYGQATYRYNISYSAGIYFRLPFEEVLSFQPEFLYFYQANSGSDGSYLQRRDTRDPISFVTHNFRMPLMFRFNNTYAKRKTMFYAELGPLLDVNFGNYWYTRYPDNKRTLPRLTGGVAAGFGLERYIDAGTSFHIGARFNWLTSFTPNRRYRNMSFELVVGFSIFKM